MCADEQFNKCRINSRGTNWYPTKAVFRLFMDYIGQYLFLEAICVQWMMRVFDGSTLVGGDEGDILGSGRHTEYLVAINLPLYLRQVSKGAGDARRKIWNMTHLHQQLYRDRST